MAEIGAIASVIGIASTGAKLSIALFDFASTIGSAATEITSVSTEISQFCVVVKQIESTLRKARTTVRYSITALAAIEQITGQCQPVFDEFEKILKELKKGKAEPNFLGRLKWTLKRSKVQILQKTLEASKLTLSCMLMTLLFAENVSSRSDVTIETGEEDEHQRVVTQSLLVARQCAVNDLENLENSVPLGDTGPEFSPCEDNFAEPLNDILVPMGMRSPNRHLRIMDGVLLDLAEMPADNRERRSSILLNEIMAGDPTDLRRLTMENALSPSYIHRQLIHLLEKWTDQGHRLSRLIANGQPAFPEEQFGSVDSDGEDYRTGLGNMSIGEMSIKRGANPNGNSPPQFSISPPTRLQPPHSHRRSKSEPSAARVFRDPHSDSDTSFTRTSNTEQDDNTSHNTSGLESSVSASVEIHKKFRASSNDPCYKVLPVILKKYNINADWRNFDIYIAYGSEERRLELEEKPGLLLKILDKEGKKPMFILRKARVDVNI